MSKQIISINIFWLLQNNHDLCGNSVELSASSVGSAGHMVRCLRIKTIS